MAWWCQIAGAGDTPPRGTTGPDRGGRDPQVARWHRFEGWGNPPLRG